MIVIGHRGAPGHRPENTLASHELALRAGADRVECDVVPTADGVLVVRHDADLTDTTDVARRPALAHLQRRRTGDGSRGSSGWQVDDLTLEQVRTLRAVERMPGLRPGSSLHDGLLEVPTLAQLLLLVAALRAETGRDLSLAIEVKDPAVFARAGLDVATMLDAELRAPGAAGVPVVVQCFDPRFLQRLAGTGLPLVQLLHPWPAGLAVADRDDAPGGRGWPTVDEMCTDDGLARIAGYASVLAPHKDLVMPEGRDGSWGVPTDLVDRAHAHGLAVHVFSLRDENAFLPACLRVGDDPGAHGCAGEEYAAMIAAGVDGVFSDHPATGVAAVSAARVASAAGAVDVALPAPAAVRTLV